MNSKLVRDFETDEFKNRLTMAWVRAHFNLGHLPQILFWWILLSFELVFAFFLTRRLFLLLFFGMYQAAFTSCVIWIKTKRFTECEGAKRVHYIKSIESNVKDRKSRRVRLLINIARHHQSCAVMNNRID